MLKRMADRIAYAVTATLPDPQTASAYIAWLKDGHLDAVINAGAHSAMIIKHDPPATAHDPPHTHTGQINIETRYIFPTREVFQHYEKHHAPALRQDGIQRFGNIQGVTFKRTLGEIL